MIVCLDSRDNGARMFIRKERRRGWAFQVDGSVFIRLNEGQERGLGLDKEGGGGDEV